MIEFDNNPYTFLFKKAQKKFISNKNLHRCLITGTCLPTGIHGSIDLFITYLSNIYQIYHQAPPSVTRNELLSVSRPFLEKQRYQSELKVPFNS